METASELLIDRPDHAQSTLILAHGAGLPMDSEFMNRFAEGLCALGHQIVRFEFPYMARRRQQGGQRPPDRMPVLEECFKSVYESVSDRPLFIGGKSLGGRVASRIADELQCDGLVCLGYPFHPPGKPQNLRTEHLKSLSVRTLIIQGTRDPFGSPEDVASYQLSKSIETIWLEDGDHSFKPRVKSGRTEDENIEQAITAIGQFMSRAG